MSEEPAAQAHALLERLFALLHDCRALVPQLEPGSARRESASAEAERLLYFALVGAIEAGLVLTAEDALTVLRQASRPLGPMGAEWLELLPNPEKCGILNKTERGILDPRTAGTQEPGPAARVQREAIAHSQAFWTALLAAPRGPSRSRPRLYSKQVASHVLDANQIPALSEVHRQERQERGLDQA